MATTVLALFDNPQMAQTAVDALEQAGYRRSSISMEAFAPDVQSTTAPSQKSGWEKLMAKLHLTAPQDHVDFYARGVHEGGTLVSIETSDDAAADNAADILDQHGALDLDERTSQFLTGQSSVAATTDIASDASMVNTEMVNPGSQEVIPVIEEQLEVGKRQVQRGGVRVYQRVTERPVEKQITLRKETVTVDRRPVDRPATDADAAFQEQSFEVTETAEVPIVSKQARVVEEVSIGKMAEERIETVHDTVRRTDVEVERLDDRDTRDINR